MKSTKIATPILTVIATIGSAAFGAILDRILDMVLNTNKSVTIPICWWSIGAICVIITSLIMIVAKIIKMKQEYQKQKEQQSNELEKQKLELEQQKIKLEQKKAKINNLDIGDPSAKGNSYLLMALSQNIYAPLKYEMLRVAAEKYNNVLAGVILGSVYESGLQSNGKTLIEKDYNQAYNLYKKVNDYDPYGITDWTIGWLYENDLISDSKILCEEKRLKKALEYYNLSLKKRYPKAFNSIGKFNLYGLAGLSKDRPEAIANFKDASKLGDAYAAINCGHSEMKRYYEKGDTSCLDTAEHYFRTAEIFNSPEALLHLGIVSEERAKINNNSEKFLDDAKTYYVKASAYTGKYSATGFYKLGCLIRDNDKFKDDKEIIVALGKSQHTDLAVECFIRAYSMFEDFEQSQKLNGKYIDYFNDLKNSFCNAKNDFDYTDKTTA